jgi:CheY-like chemotaxis protein
MITKNNPSGDSVKELVARHLRAADILVKEGNLAEAIVQIERALEIDPKSYYARSFLDRVRVQQRKAPKTIAPPEPSKPSAEDRKIEQISLLLRTADQLLVAKHYRLARQQVEKVFAIDPQNYYAKTYAEKIAKLADKEPKESARPPASSSQPEVQKPQPPQPEPEQPQWTPGERASVAMYRELLKEMWFDGKVTEGERKELRKVRDIFKITEEEAGELEKQVQVDAYVEALRIAWKDGAITQNENDVLVMMREKFNISMEEHLSAEAKILWAKNAPRAKSILLADDEPTLLLTLATKLRGHGYEVLTAESVEKALEILQHSTPAIIVSDLLFGEAHLTGIEFYQRVRNDTRLQNVPFLLMSGISDEFVVRAGMRLGVDSFIQKPFDLELLLATIEGKLKS